MRIKLIACKLLQREIMSLAAVSKSIIDVSFMRQDYHLTPLKLREILQREIDSIEADNNDYTNSTNDRDFDAIVLGYGLCSNAVVGLKSKKYKLVVPKAHDCATLLMGSKEMYKKEFEENSGSFLYAQCWLELGIDEGEQKIERLRKEYMEKYDDEDTVEYLLDVERDMLKNYSQATFVNWQGFTNPEYIDQVKKMAQDKNWSYHQVEGNNSLIKDLLDGNWDEERFIVLEPGETIEVSSDENVIRKAES